VAGAPDQQQALEQGLRSLPPVAVFIVLFLFWNRFVKSGPRARWLWGMAAVAILIGRDVAAYHAFEWQERVIAFDVLPPLIAFCAGYWIWRNLTAAYAEASPAGDTPKEA